MTRDAFLSKWHPAVDRSPTFESDVDALIRLAASRCSRCDGTGVIRTPSAYAGIPYMYEEKCRECAGSGKGREP